MLLFLVIKGIKTGHRFSKALVIDLYIVSDDLGFVLTLEHRC
jgi:hypothetical protein